MSNSKNSFNWIAPFYDSLTKLFFGKAFYKAQIHFLSEIPKKGRVLIIGGGTGWILNELLRINPDCEVHYVEASSKMVEKTRRRVSPKHKVKFIFGSENSIPRNGKYDAVITNFFLDLFSESLTDVILKIKRSLSKNSIWIVTDFEDNGKLWQKVMLKTMYFFFRVTSRIEASQIPDIEEELKKQGIKKSKEEIFLGSFIRSSVYRISE